jgi:hypothetical protein
MTCPDLIAYYAPPDGVTVIRYADVKQQIYDLLDAWYNHPAILNGIDAQYVGNGRIEYRIPIPSWWYEIMAQLNEEWAPPELEPPPDWPRDFWGTP